MRDPSFESAALDQADFARIVSYQNAHRCTFAQAALALGLMDRSELGELLRTREPVGDNLLTSRPFGRGSAAEPWRETAPAQRVFKGLAAEYLDTARPDRELLVSQDPFHPRSETLRALRTTLLPRLPEDVGVALVVASSERADGRSRLAAELAITLSQIEQPTLLLDADMRQPAQQRLFGLERRDTLASVLADSRMPRPQAVVGFPQLHVMPAGERVANPLELLTQRSFSQLLQLATQHYRFVVIDTPPIAHYSDALAVTQAARRVIYVARLGMSPLDGCRSAVARIEAVGSILGSVLNRF